MKTKSWGWVGLCFALMVPPFVFGLMRNFSAPQAQGVHLAPFAMRQVEACALALPIIPAMFLIGLVFARRWWWGAGLSVIGLQVLGLVAGGALMTVTSPDFLFGPSVVRTELSANGERAGHIFRSEFLMCNWNLYLGAPGDAVVREVDTAPCVKDVEPRVGWMEDGGVKLTRPDGQLLRP